MAETPNIIANTPKQDSTSKVCINTSAHLGSKDFDRSSVQSSEALNPSKSSHTAVNRSTTTAQAQRTQELTNKSSTVSFRQGATAQTIAAARACSQDPQRLLADLLLASCDGIASLERELEDFCNQPLSYIKSAAVNFAHNPLGCLRRICSATISALLFIPKLAYQSVKALFEAGTESSPSSASSSDEASALTYADHGLLGGLNKKLTESVNISAPTNNQVNIAASPVKYLVDLEADIKGKKTFLGRLQESLLVLVEALLEKKRKKEEEQKIEDPLERQERLSNEAGENLRVAESLRPDLANHIKMPQTACIFSSAFGEIPNAEALIAQAEREEAAESLVTELVGTKI